MLHHSKDKIKPPRSLRSARRSLVKNKISTPLSFPTSMHASLAAPKKIIKALYDYQAQGPHELSFSQGDFFHVVGRENDDQWFEACNPATNSKGIVPVSYFQVLDKSERSLPVQQPAAASKADSGFVDEQDITHGTKKMQPLYGVVLYDFQAERSDELDAKAGEPIIVIAQSNQEWFVAKPIGRLGGPGLIPVSFVEVRDAMTGRPVTNVQSSKSTPIVPRVEEWKKMTQGYEASSISLGTLDKHQQSPSSSISSGYLAPHHEVHEDEDGKPDDILDSYGMQHLVQPADQPLSDMSSTDTRSPRSTRSDRPIVVSATIDSFILEGDQYWFIVYAHLNNGRHRVLYRLYEDFHDFQINLLHDYPLEAGQADRERILPYMPGPLTTVDEEITAERQRDLDQYCRELLSLPRYLSESALVQNQLFGIHEGDIETEYDPRTGAVDEDPFPAPSPAAGPSPAMAPVVTSSKSNTTTTAGKVKLKIVHKDDIFAIKVPSDSKLDQVTQKVIERLGFDVSLRYKDETTGDSLPLVTEADMEDAFVSAVKLGKLTVYAEQR
ncbi:hypothetical protein BCR43DRAFT_493463 [Syncephalastrum racemosum]|uniref:Uncharacterized protein n=1 Tax=Syncephalastrum racemosum TaxID=13706 RepID=A0A1X2HAK8_SYNRA|nr:hypothetical protein BCR43DRAFT_493463 [Syncephalastrum racemosum]